MPSTHDPQLYVHIRIVMGMILGLAVARLLNGFAKFIQHPKENAVSVLHLGWAANTLLNAILFWWWEYRLSTITHWTFGLYFFVLSYTSLFYFMCVLLFPDHLGEYKSYSDYFYSKRRWFFGLMALAHLVDIYDTFIKGEEYFQVAGAVMGVESVVAAIGCLIAGWTTNRYYHRFFLAFTLLELVFRVGWLLYTVN